MPDFMTFFYMLIMLCIIFAAYLTARFVAVKAKGITKGKYIQVIDRIFLGKDKGIMIVRIGGKVYVMAEHAGGMSVIAELTEDDLDLVESGDTQFSFKQILNTYLGLPQEDTVSRTPSYSNLSELKMRMADSLNHMIRRHEVKERTNDKENKMD